MSATDVRRWIERFDAVAAVERAERVGSPRGCTWALGVSLPMISAARAALSLAPALAAHRADEDARVRAVWDRLRARLRR